MGEKEKGSTCGKATKGIARRETSALYEGKSTEKKIKEDRGRRGGTYGQATRGTARVEKEFSSRVEEESRGALQQGDTERSTPTRVRMVYERNDSNIHIVQKVLRL